MKIVVGLGNPGLEYQRTRHNVGFDCIDRLARQLCKTVGDGSSTPRARFQALAVEGESSGEKVLLLKPMTYMNLSGSSVAEALRFYKLDATRDLLVIVDDIALPCGAIRLRSEGSAGGHNGLRSTIQHLGSEEFARLRIGIGAPLGDPQERKERTVSHVLGPFRASEHGLLKQVLAEVCKGIELIQANGLEKAGNRLNGFRPST